MKKINLTDLLNAELERTYHNATLGGKLRTESDYESDLVQSQVEIECQDAIADLRFTCPKIFNYGEVYQWGRGGRTLAPEQLIIQGGGGSFRIKSAEDLNLSAFECRELLKTLREFNDLVENFCAHVVDNAIEFIREEFKNELEEKKGKKRVVFTGVRYE